MLHTHLFFDFQTFQSDLKSPIPVLPLNLGTKVDLDDNVWGTQNWGPQSGLDSKGGEKQRSECTYWLLHTADLQNSPALPGSLTSCPVLFLLSSFSPSLPTWICLSAWVCQRLMSLSTNARHRRSGWNDKRWGIIPQFNPDHSQSAALKHQTSGATFPLTHHACSLFLKTTQTCGVLDGGAEEDTHISAFGNDFTLFKDAQLCEAEWGREMKDYLFLLGGRQRVSESQWEGGRAAVRNKQTNSSAENRRSYQSRSLGYFTSLTRF